VLSDVKYNFMSACPMRIDAKTDFARIRMLFEGLERDATRSLREDGFGADEIAIQRSMDMRYVGQVHECTVEIGNLEVGPKTIDQIRRAFDETHKQLFTYAEPQSMVEIVNIESTVFGRVSKPVPPALPPAKGDASAARIGMRRMVFGAGQQVDRVEAPVYDGARLGPGHRIPGPAVIEEETTSILVEPGWAGELHQSGSYILRPL
jgi:N-methylhydantoinase A